MIWAENEGRESNLVMGTKFDKSDKGKDGLIVAMALSFFLVGLSAGADEVLEVSSIDSRPPACESKVSHLQWAFVSFDDGLPADGQWRHGFDVADMDGDGHLDIVHGPARKGTGLPSIFRGNGAGRWELWGGVRFPDRAYDYGDIEAADFNGDGKMDLALAMHLRGVTVLVGNGKGAFETWGEGLPYASTRAESAAPRFSSRAIESADWNGDGLPDLLALFEGPQIPQPGSGAPLVVGAFYSVSVFLNGGHGVWSEAAASELMEKNFGDAIEVGHFDDDNTLDFVTASQRLSFTKVLGLGRSDGTWRQESLFAIRPRSYLKTVAVGDLNGDGRDDLVLSYSCWSDNEPAAIVDVVYQGETWRRETLIHEKKGELFTALGVGDIDGDGRADVVVGDALGRLRVFTGTAPYGLTQKKLASPLRAEQQCYDIDVVDLNGDDRAEIVASFAGEAREHSGSIRVWRLETGANT